MKNSRIHLFVNVIATSFIFLFVYTASAKLFAFTLFKNTLYKSPLIDSYAPAFAILIPSIELIIAAALLFQTTLRLGLYLATALMLLFTFYVAWMLLFIPELPCSCGGIIQSLSWTGHLLLNIFFLTLGTIGILLTNKPATNISLSA